MPWNKIFLLYYYLVTIRNELILSHSGIRIQKELKVILWYSFAVFFLYSEIKSRFSPFQSSKVMVTVTQLIRKHRHFLIIEVSNTLQ